MRSQIHIVPDSPALAAESQTEVSIAAGSDPITRTITLRPREPFARFRRLRGDAAAQAGAAAAVDDAVALKLQVMLLSEENARLTAARHQPADLGTLVDQMRRLGAQEGDGEVLDEAWTMLSECLVIREGLDRACIEIQAAIGDVRERLGSLAIRLDDAMPAAAADPAVALRHASLSP